MTKTTAIGLAGALLLSACGEDKATDPTTSVPNIAGTYSGTWTVQFRRAHDGFTGSFFCGGSLTIRQSRGSGGGVAPISGFAVVSSSCPPLSFDLSGSVQSDGGVAFVTGAPRPPQGQCPPASGAAFAGLATGNTLSARASVTLFCPGPGEGEHRFDYILSGRKTS